MQSMLKEAFGLLELYMNTQHTLGKIINVWDLHVNKLVLVTLLLNDCT